MKLPQCCLSHVSVIHLGFRQLVMQQNDMKTSFLALGNQLITHDNNHKSLNYENSWQQPAGLKAFPLIRSLRQWVINATV